MVWSIRPWPKGVGSPFWILTCLSESWLLLRLVSPGCPSLVSCRWALGWLLLWIPYVEVRAQIRRPMCDYLGFRCISGFPSFELSSLPYLTHCVMNTGLGGFRGSLNGQSLHGAAPATGREAGSSHRSPHRPAPRTQERLCVCVPVYVNERVLPCAPVRSCGPQLSGTWKDPAVTSGV